MKNDLQIYLETKVQSQLELIKIMESHKIPTIKEIILQKGKLEAFKEALEFTKNLK